MTADIIIQTIIGVVLTGALGVMWRDIRKGNAMQNRQLKKALYNKDGTTIFMPRSECGKAHDNFCQKIDEVKNIVKEGDLKRDTARKEDATERKQLHIFMGKVQAHMENGGMNNAGT